MAYSRVSDDHSDSQNGDESAEQDLQKKYMPGVLFPLGGIFGFIAEKEPHEGDP